MARIRVKVGTRYIYKDQMHVIRDVLPDTCYRVEQAGSGQEIAVSYQEILEAWESGELRFEGVGQNAVRDTQVAMRTIDQSLADLPETVRQETWRRYHLVLEVYRFYALEPVQILPRRDIEAYIKENEALDHTSDEPTAFTPAHSAKSIERYMQALVESGGDIRSLIPQTGRRGGKGQARMDNAIERILQTVLQKYANITERDSSVDQIMTDVINAVADECHDQP